MPRRLLPLLVVLLAWATGACQLTLAAGVDVARDGTGRVSAGLGLDAAAAGEIGDLATALRLDDVRRAGWQVDGPRPEGDGLTWVRASKPFVDAAEVPAILAELNGPDGPFRDFRVERTESILRSRTTFTGTLDLSRGLAGLADPELLVALGEVDLGLDVAGLQRRFGDGLAGAVGVRVTAGLPGEVTGNAPARDGRRSLWRATPGETVQLTATSDASRIDPAAAVTAAASLLTAVALLVVLLRRRRRSK